MKQNYFHLVILVLLISSIGCNGFEFKANKSAKPIKSDELSAAPKSNKQTFQIGDLVAVIDDKGLFKSDCRILEAESNGYKVKIGEGRGSKTINLLPEQIFSVPWSGARNLKVGDTVYELRFGDFERRKGEIIKISDSQPPRFLVRFDNNQTEKLLDNEKVFSAIEEVDFEDLSIGEIVYFEKFRWAIVIKKQDGKVVIREDGFPGEKLVEAEKLERIK